MKIAVDIPLVQVNGPGRKTVCVMAISPVAAIWTAQDQNPGWTFQYSMTCGDRGGAGNAKREREAKAKAMAALWKLFSVV